MVRITRYSRVVRESGLEAPPGTYALLLSSSTDREISIGRLCSTPLQPGFYIYVGSAFGPGGVRARVKHHLQISSGPHWHIDYIRPCVKVEEVWVCYGRKRREHRWAKFLSSMRGVSVPMRGFGASDCGCEAHLFFFESCAMRGRIRDALSAQGASATVVVR